MMFVIQKDVSLMRVSMRMALKKFRRNASVAQRFVKWMIIAIKNQMFVHNYPSVYRQMVGQGITNNVSVVRLNATI